jgi:hypothetical protein
VLLADELKVDEVDTKLKAFVLSTSPDLLIHYTGVSGSIEIVTNSGTEFIDQSPMPVANFSLANLSAGDFVAIEGVEVAGKVIAGRIERRDSTIPDDSELDGQADSFVPNTSITVLGISFMVDNGTLTQYMDVSGNTSALLFFGNLKMGDRVEIKDKDPADGFADEVKLDD